MLVFIPHSYWAALLMTILTMFCWGSWTNTQKLAKGWRFELFYWDYMWGTLVCFTLAGLTFGRTDPASPESFFRNLASAGNHQMVYALLAGIIFNFGNLFLVAAIAIAGMAVGFPVALGVSLVVSTILNYLVSPQGNALLLFGGVLLVGLAIILDGLAYRKILAGTDLTARGISFSLLSGLALGLFYPLLAKSMKGVAPLAPYSMGFLFILGAVISNFAMNYVFMRRPVSGSPLRMREYLAGTGREHLWGLMGGLIFGIGTISNFVTSAVHMIGPAVSYSLGQGAPLIAAVWGVFVWREFRSAGKSTYGLIALMFSFYLFGLISIALAPVVKR
jgi:glucose uptake protein